MAVQVTDHGKVIAEFSTRAQAILYCAENEWIQPQRNRNSKSTRRLLPHIKIVDIEEKSI